MKVEANGGGSAVQLLQTPGHGSHVVGVEVKDNVSTKARHLEIVTRSDRGPPDYRLEANPGSGVRHPRTIAMDEK